jgi:hypothetical protein
MADFGNGKNILLLDVSDSRILDNIIDTTNDGIHSNGYLENILIEGNIISTRFNVVDPLAHDDSIQLRSTRIDGLMFRRNILANSDQNIFQQSLGSGPWRNISVLGNLSIQAKGGSDFQGKHFLFGSVENVRVEGNTLVTLNGGYAHGVHMTVGGSFTVKGNIFYNSLYMSKASGSNSDYNFFYDTSAKQVITGYNSLASYQAANPGTDPHSREGNVLFVDEAAQDFRLRALSPALNAGSPLADLATDLDGVMRPASGAWDIGAYEQ